MTYAWIVSTPMIARLLIYLLRDLKRAVLRQAINLALTCGRSLHVCHQHATLRLDLYSVGQYVGVTRLYLSVREESPAK
jgi:hypothetical protein